MALPSSGTSIILRSPSLTAFSTAGGTSFALPYPQPTFPRPLPTITIPLKLKRRPPLTTAAQRRILMTFSIKSPLREESREVSVDMGVLSLKTQAGLSGRFGKGRHAAMIFGTASIETNLLDTSRQGALSNRAPDGLCGRLVATVFNVTFELRFRGRRRRQRGTLGVINQLRIGVLQAADNAKSRTTWCATNVLSHAPPPAPPLQIDLLLMIHIRMSPSPTNSADRVQCRLFCNGLARLAAHLFAFVADALALVRFRLAHRAHFSRELPDGLLIDTFNHNVSLVRARYVEARGNRQLDFVGEANAQLQHIFLNACNVTDADNLQLFFITLAHAFDHVANQGAS